MYQIMRTHRMSEKISYNFNPTTRCRWSASCSERAKVPTGQDGTWKRICSTHSHKYRDPSFPDRNQIHFTEPEAHCFSHCAIMFSNYNFLIYSYCIIFCNLVPFLRTSNFT
jgi:hypothetical protein